MVTTANVRRFCPNAKPALVDAIVSHWEIADDAGINTPLRIRMFLASIAVETGGLTTIVENLNYTSAQRIYDTFKGPKSNPRFKSPKDCTIYVKQPSKLGIKVYGGRMGNRPAPSTDGYDFRGGGMLQTTGRDGYAAVGFEDNPRDLQTDPVIAFKTAVQEWTKRGCNALADRDDDEGVRRAINGGTNGMADFRAYLLKAKKVWPDVVADAPEPAKPVADNIYDGKPNDAVRNVQTRLDELGYFEVGKLDGCWGSRTAGAITSFQADNGLPLAAKIDQGLLAALMTAKPRIQSDERANATVSELRKEGAPEIKQTDQTKYAGYGLVGMGALKGGTEALDNVRDASGTLREIIDALQPIYGFLQDNAWWIAGGIGLFVIYKSGLLQRIRLVKHQEGSDVSL